ncbi:MAG TPA: hypothetical protein VJN67_02715 [Stellaceae bacterium]|nr:hypothetical protein [Stellaceae bacterium]
MRCGLNILLVAGLLLTLTQCAPIDDPSENNFLISFARPDPVPGNFFACYGYGCKYRARIELTDEEWQEVRAKFDPPPEDAATERQQIGEAVAQLERFFGQRTGTLVHQEDSRLNFGDPTQLDCVDNSVNTWTYLTMLAHDGLLRHHKVAGLAHRGTLLTLDFSNTAVIVQKDNGEAFVVDPWLGDAGQPPPIFTLDLWFHSA